MRPLLLPSRRNAVTPEPLQTHALPAPPPSYPEHIHSPSLPPDGHYLATSSGAWPTQPPPTPAPLVLPATDGPLKPWLGLRARLFLSLLSPSLLALLLVGATTLIGAQDIDDKIDAAKLRLVVACSGAEQSAATALSMPHYLADSINQQTSEAVEATVRGSLRVLALALVAVEQLLIFLTDTYRSLFFCFVELVVQGSLSLLMAAVAVLDEVIGGAATGIKSAIEASVSGVNAFLSTTLGGFNDVLKLIGQHIDVPTVAQPDLSALDNVKLPDSFSAGLVKLNDTLPTFDDVRQRLDALISQPFEQLKSDVNSTLSTFTFDRTLLPVPAMRTASFCADKLDTKPLDDLGGELHKLIYWTAGLLGAVALLLAAFNMLLAWYSWRSMRTHVERTREAFLASEAPSSERRDRDSKDSSSIRSVQSRDLLSTPRLLSLLELASHPLLALLAFRMARPLGIRSPRGKAHLRWWLAWIAHPMAIAALAMGLAGLAATQGQIIAIRAVESHYNGKIGATFDQLGDAILAEMNSGFTDASHDFANRSNALIIGAQDNLNNNLFSWVNTTTSTINGTLNELVSSIAGVLNDSFSSTPLYTPMQSFIDCALLSKIRSIESALSWLQSNAHVEFNTVSADILQFSDARADELVAPIKQAALGSSDGNSDGVVGSVVDSYVRRLEKERFMYCLFLCLYVLVLAIGTAVVIRHCSPRKRKEIDEHITPYHASSLPPSPPYEATQSGAQQRDATAQAHRSISRPLHPDVAALFNGAPATSTQAARPYQGTQAARSWESLLDRRSAETSRTGAASPASRFIAVPKIFQRTSTDTQRQVPQPDVVSSVGNLAPQQSSRDGPSIRSRSVYSTASGQTLPSPPAKRGLATRALDKLHAAAVWWYAAPTQRAQAAPSPLPEAPSPEAPSPTASHDTFGVARPRTREGSAWHGSSNSISSTWAGTPLRAHTTDHQPLSAQPASPQLTGDGFGGLLVSPEQQQMQERRRLRFTSTPTDQCDARRRAAEAAGSMTEAGSPAGPSVEHKPQARASPLMPPIDRLSCLAYLQPTPSPPPKPSPPQPRAFGSGSPLLPPLDRLSWQRAPPRPLPTPPSQTAQPVRSATRPHSLSGTISAAPTSVSAQPSRASLPVPQPQGAIRPVPLRPHSFSRTAAGGMHPRAAALSTISERDSSGSAGTRTAHYF